MKVEDGVWTGSSPWYGIMTSEITPLFFGILVDSLCQTFRITPKGEKIKETTLMNVRIYTFYV